MTPTDLLLSAPLSSLAPNVYAALSVDERFALYKYGGSYSVNRLTSQEWSHTFEGYVTPNQLRVGTLFDALGGSNISGAVLEHWADNLLGNIDWTMEPVVNGAVTPTASPSFSLDPIAWGFKLTATAAGDCYIEIPGPFTWTNQSVAYSVAAIGGTCFIGCNVDGAITPINASGDAWTWFEVTDTTGAAPASFRVGFTATAPGETRSFAWPQVEQAYGTSPILGGSLGGTRLGEALSFAMSQVVQSGRLNLDLDVWPSVSDRSGYAYELLYIDALNYVRLVFDPAGTPFPGYRVQVTIAGNMQQSEVIYWKRGKQLRLWLECGNGKPRVAWKYEDEAAVCASGSFTAPQGAIAAMGSGSLPGRAQVGVKQFGGVYAGVRFYPNGERPDWVGCVCGA